jgi:RHS repeat-associated protein
VGSATTYYLYDGDTPILEMQNGQAVAFNGFGGDGWRARYYPSGSPLATTFGNQAYFYTYDPEGNLVQRHNQTSGSLDGLDTVSYDAYGSPLLAVNATSGASEGHVDPIGFGGQWGYYSDVETGLQLLTHRYYDNRRGRFVTRDPIGYGGGINQYAYAGGNPTI